MEQIRNRYPPMARRKHIDEILRNWKFEPNAVLVRSTTGSDGRQLLQMRIDLGIMQLEVEGRPDGTQPFGFDTYYDYLQSQAKRYGDEFVLDEEQCGEVDREFIQFYHRRVCWLHLRRFDLAVRDADHTLVLMDLCKRYSPDEHWTMAHEQYRPFVLFHRIQAAALSVLEVEDEPEQAIEIINNGLDELREVFREYEAEEQFEDDELVGRLVSMREDLRKKYAIGKTLHEKLADAVEAEEYELAARLRDELARRGHTL